MKNIWTIVKKELDKVFKDKRAFFSTIILPGFIIFIIYALMGSVMDVSSKQVQEDSKTIAIINPVPAITKIQESIFEENNIIVRIEENDNELETFIESVKSGDLDGLVVFNENFEENVQDYINNQGEVTANVDLYFDTTSTKSSVCYSVFQQVLSTYQISLQGGVSEFFHQNFKKDEIVDPLKEAGLGLGMLVPMLLITFVFAGAMGVSSDSIAGEKERGTIQTLFMAPISKREIILGKITSTTILTICCSLGSFIGIVASLPFAGSLFNIVGSISYGFIDYLSLLLLILSISLLAVSFLMVLSTIAKNIKEASMLSMPIYMVAIIVSMLSMYMDGLPKELYYYFIPIFNVSLGIKGVLINSLNIEYLLIIIGVNLLIFAAAVYLLTKLFEKEKIMYAK